MAPRNIGNAKRLSPTSATVSEANAVLHLDTGQSLDREAPATPEWKPKLGPAETPAFVFDEYPWAPRNASDAHRPMSFGSPTKQPLLHRRNSSGDSPGRDWSPMGLHRGMAWREMQHLVIGPSTPTSDPRNKHEAISPLDPSPPISNFTSSFHTEDSVPRHQAQTPTRESRTKSSPRNTSPRPRGCVTSDEILSPTKHHRGTPSAATFLSLDSHYSQHSEAVFHYPEANANAPAPQLSLDAASPTAAESVHPS
jgi:hypothetical protein